MVCPGFRRRPTWSSALRYILTEPSNRVVITRRSASRARILNIVPNTRVRTAFDSSHSQLPRPPPWGFPLRHCQEQGAQPRDPRGDTPPPHPQRDSPTAGCLTTDRELPYRSSPKIAPLRAQGLPSPHPSAPVPPWKLTLRRGTFAPLSAAGRKILKEKHVFLRLKRCWCEKMT